MNSPDQDREMALQKVNRIVGRGQALGEAIYQAAQAEQAASGGGSANDDVVDAEVVEDDQEPK